MLADEKTNKILTLPLAVRANLGVKIVRPTDVTLTSTADFEPGDLVLLTDSSGVSERAEVSAKAPTFLRLRSVNFWRAED